MIEDNKKKHKENNNLRIIIIKKTLRVNQQMMETIDPLLNQVSYWFNIWL